VQKGVPRRGPERGVHLPPRAVFTFRSLSFAAMAAADYRGDRAGWHQARCCGYEQVDSPNRRPCQAIALFLRRHAPSWLPVARRLDAPAPYAAFALAPKGTAAASNNRATWTADQLPPRGAGMPRSSSPAAARHEPRHTRVCVIQPRSRYRWRA
jgi:hypothetical protein